MNWNQHISNICKKANNIMSFLKRNLNIRNANIKEKAYKSLVRPTLEYACTTWDPYLKEDKKRIEMVQRRAARYVVNRYNAVQNK
jgi:asparagine synthetase B (glutamine-hydrolysing)